MVLPDLFSVDMEYDPLCPNKMENAVSDGTWEAKRIAELTKERDYAEERLEQYEKANENFRTQLLAKETELVQSKKVTSEWVNKNFTCQHEAELTEKDRQIEVARSSMNFHKLRADSALTSIADLEAKLQLPENQRVLEIRRLEEDLANSKRSTWACFIGDWRELQWWYPGRPDLYMSSEQLAARREEFEWKMDICGMQMLWPFIDGKPMLYGTIEENMLKDTAKDEEIRVLKEPSRQALIFASGQARKLLAFNIQARQDKTQIEQLESDLAAARKWDKVKQIETLWNSYRAILPKDASANQIIETRRAFYAGAQGLFHAILTGLDSGDEPTDDDMKKIDDIHAELEEFAELVGNGVA